MRLYSGLSTHFILDTARNQIAEKLRTAFFQAYRYEPSPGEVNAWRNSLRAVAQVFETGGLKDHGVIVEYQLPLTSKRLDCLICGKDGGGGENAVIIELKQWDRCEEAVGDKLVTTWMQGRPREILHPSAQVGQYEQYLADAHTAFHEGPRPMGLASCAYLHNYTPAPDDVIYSDVFAPLLARSPTFSADHFDELQGFLAGRLSGGDGLATLQRIEESKYRPSKKLMEHVSGLIKGNPAYVLLDEQLVVYEKVMACARAGFHDRRKTVLIIRGGPGTGKSVIAMNLVGDLMAKQHNAQYATGSRAFTETLRNIMGSRGAAQFKYFNSYGDAETNVIDVLVCDEAHRIRKTSHSFYTPKAKRSGKPQIDEIIGAAKVCVFLIDDKQIVRPDEIGSVPYIQERAEALGCRIHEYALEAQFRCAGSDGFINWVNNTLGIERTANVLWDAHDPFEFRILDSPEALEAEIRRRVAAGATGRVTAGFCWEWSNARPDGTLVDDVVIGEYRRPWNAKPESGRLARGIPKSNLWAYDPRGIDQVGCVYTAQGFEFDYTGVIFGQDLVYRFDPQGWVGQPEHSRDTKVRRAKGQFVDLAKNTYRVLLTRGLKGCFVHFIDKETERFVRSRIERL
jgi:hypothetical protein